MISQLCRDSVRRLQLHQLRYIDLHLIQTLSSFELDMFLLQLRTAVNQSSHELISFLQAFFLLLGDLFQLVLGFEIGLIGIISMFVQPVQAFLVLLHAIS